MVAKKKTPRPAAKGVADLQAPITSSALPTITPDPDRPGNHIASRVLRNPDGSASASVESWPLSEPELRTLYCASAILERLPYNRWPETYPAQPHTFSDAEAAVHEIARDILATNARFVIAQLEWLAVRLYAADDFAERFGNLVGELASDIQEPLSFAEVKKRGAARLPRIQAALLEREAMKAERAAKREQARQQLNVGRPAALRVLSERAELLKREIKTWLAHWNVANPYASTKAAIHAVQQERFTSKKNGVHYSESYLKKIVPAILAEIRGR